MGRAKACAYREDAQVPGTSSMKTGDFYDRESDESFFQEPSFKCRLFCLLPFACVLIMAPKFDLINSQTLTVKLNCFLRLSSILQTELTNVLLSM